MPLVLLATLVYAVVLVLALAASLLVILFYLLRIRAVLAEARGALFEVQERSVPLRAVLEPLRDALSDAGGPVIREYEAAAGTDRLSRSRPLGALSQGR